MKGFAAKSTSRQVLAFLVGCSVFVQTCWICSAAGTEVFGDEGGYVDLRCEPEYDVRRPLFWGVDHGSLRHIVLLVKDPGQDIEILEQRYAGRLSLRDGNDLRISNLNRDDDSVDSTDPAFIHSSFGMLGAYRCNQQGTTGTEWTLRVRRTPAPPTDLAVIAAKLYAVTVEVTGGHDGLLPQSLCVWYREQGTEEWKKGKGENSCKNGVTEGEEVTLQSTLPTANTTYQVCVVAQNRLNSSRCEDAYIQATTDSLMDPSEETAGHGQGVAVWAVPVSVMAAAFLVSIGVAAFCLIKRRRTLNDHEEGASNHEYDMVDPEIFDEEYEMIDRQDSRPPARSLQAPATVPPPLGVSGAQSDSDYQALDPSTMCNTNSDDLHYENDPEYQNTFGKIYQNA